MDFLLEHSDTAKLFWGLVFAYGLLPVLGIFLGLCVLIGLGDCAKGISSKRAKRVTVVLLLVVIALAVAFIVFAAGHDWR